MNAKLQASYTLFLQLSKALKEDPKEFIFKEEKEKPQK